MLKKLISLSTFLKRMTLGLFMRMMIRNGMICIDSAYFTDFNEMIFGHVVGLEFWRRSFSNLNLPHMPNTGNTCHYLSLSF